MALGQLQPSKRSVPAPIALGFWLAMGLIELVAAVVRLWGIGRYHGLIYDEYYYVPAADVLLGRKPPVHVAHAVAGIDPNLLSHPPFAKELIAASIVLLGNHPWAWRMPSALLGLAIPPLIYVIGRRMFGSPMVGMVAALLAACDGLLISLSRLALPDGVAVPLVAANLAVLWIFSDRAVRGQRVSRRGLVLWGGLLGLGFAAKWIGAQTILMAWIWTAMQWRSVRQNRVWWWLSALTIIPLAFYLATYAYALPSGFHQSWLPKNPLIAVFVLQWQILKDMWTLKFFHPWTSNAFTWLILPRPTAFLIIYGKGTVMRLFSMADPLVVWAGVVSLVVLSGMAWRRTIPARPVLFLWVWLAVFYATWLATPRSKFTYYFASAEMGLLLALAMLLTVLWQNRRPWLKGLGIGVGAGIGLSIIALLPLFTATPMPTTFYNAIWPNNWNPRQKSSPTSFPTSMAGTTYHPLKVSVARWLVSRPTGSSSQAATQLTPGRNARYGGSGSSFAGFGLRFPGAIDGRVAVSASQAYFGTSRGQVDAVSLSSHRVLWSVGVPNEVMGAPTVTSSLVIVGLGNPVFSQKTAKNGWMRGTGTSGLMAFNRTTGQEMWFYRTRGEDMASPVLWGSDVIDVTGNGRLVVVNAASGKEVWSRSLGGFDSHSSPLIIGSHLYVATNRYRSSFPATASWVTGVNLKNHNLLWRRKLPVQSGLADSSVALVGNTLIVPGISRVVQNTTMTEKVFGLNLKTGQTLWQTVVGRGKLASSQVETVSALVDHKLVFVSNPAARSLVALTPNGHLLWQRQLGARVFSTPVAMGQYLLVGDQSGRLSWLSAANGHTVDTIRVGLGPISNHMVVLGRQVLFGTGEGWFVNQPLAWR